MEASVVLMLMAVTAFITAWVTSAVASAKAERRRIHLRDLERAAWTQAAAAGAWLEYRDCGNAVMIVAHWPAKAGYLEVEAELGLATSMYGDEFMWRQALSRLEMESRYAASSAAKV